MFPSGLPKFPIEVFVSSVFMPILASKAFKIINFTGALTICFKKVSTSSSA